MIDNVARKVDVMLQRDYREWWECTVRFPTTITDGYYKAAQSHFVLIRHTLSRLLSL